MTYGVSTLEMASAFSTLENEGVFRKPTCIKKITDSQGNVILQDTVVSKVVYEENAAKTMTNILKDVLTYGTGTAYNIDNAICAGKTGTTNDTNDSWFVGYSKYYTTAVWVGYDLPKSLDADYGRISSGMIWKNFMNNIHENLEFAEFPEYIKEIVTEEETTETQVIYEETTLETEENQIYDGSSSGGTSTPEDSMYQGN